MADTVALSTPAGFLEFPAARAQHPPRHHDLIDGAGYRRQGILLGTNPASPPSTCRLCRALPACARRHDRKRHRVHTAALHLAPPRALHILRACGTNQRFVDDLFTISNPYVDCLPTTRGSCTASRAVILLASTHAREGLRDCFVP